MNNTGQNVTDSLVAPYQPHVVILSYIYVAVVTILIFTNIALIIVRRNKQPVKIRSPQFIIFHLLSMWLIAMPLVIRLIVSRATFPCFIYTMVYCVAVPLGFLPFLIRIYRFVLVFRVSNMQLSKDANAGKRIKIIKRLMSLRVMWSVSLLLIFLHILLWAAVSGILTATEKFNFFTVTGCKAGKFVYVPIAILAIYAVVILVLLILLVRGVKEPYFIRAETIAVVIIWLVILIQFGVCGSVPQFDDRIELNFPAGTLVFCGVFLDVLLTSIIPLIMTFQKKYNVGDTSAVNNDEILQILSSEQKRAELKDFAVRSVCAESIIFWEQIQELKLISEEDIRQETIIRLYDNFLVKDSPLELNVPMSKVTPVAEAIQAHTTSGATLSPNLFSELEDHCVTDLRDIFCRFSETKQGALVLKTIEREGTQRNLLQSAGLITGSPQKRAHSTPLSARKSLLILKRETESSSVPPSPVESTSKLLRTPRGRSDSSPVTLVSITPSDTSSINF